MKLHASFVAAVALSFVALGQEPKDDDDAIDVKIVGPEAQVIELDDVDIAEIAPDGALGSFILGVQGKAQDDAKKPKKQDDRKERVIEKEIDLGNGQTLKIVITGRAKGDFQPFGDKFEGMRRPRVAPAPMPPMMKQFFGGNADDGRPAPRGFRFEVGEGGPKAGIERAVRAFERAREAFMKALKDGEGEEREGRDRAERRRAVIAKPDGEAKVYVEKLDLGEMVGKMNRIEKAERAEKAERSEKSEKADKEIIEKKAELRRARALGGADVQFVREAPGAAKQAREIDELRKEIKELEKMVRDLKDAVKKGE